MDWGDVVGSLLGEPSLGAAAEDFRGADGHFGGGAGFALTSSESALRVTPRAAASVTVVLTPAIHERANGGFGGSGLSTST